MNEIRVAVTGVGGGIGQSIIKALKKSKYNIIALDGDVLATGLYQVEDKYIIPYAQDPRYIETLLDICEKAKVKILFPGLDAELSILSDNRDRFKEIGTNVIISNRDVIDICDDKYKTYDFLSKLNLPCPKTVFLEKLIKNKGLLTFPIIIKPKKGGARSVRVYKFENIENLELALRLFDLNVEDFIAQEYIEGEEYTCSIVRLDNQIYGPIIMRRVLRCGDTYKCFVERNEEITELLIKVMSSLKPFGACNIQLKLKNRVPYIFEMNARCSGTTAARALVGFNEPKMICDYLLSNKKPNYLIKEISILRYWNELVVENKEIEKISAKRKA